MDFARNYRQGCVADTVLARNDLLGMFEGFTLDLENLSFVNGATTLDSPAPNRMVFLERFTPALADALLALRSENMLFIVTADFPSVRGQARLVSDAPRAAYTKIINRLFGYEDAYWQQTVPIHPSAVIAPSARLMPGVVIGRNSVIGAGCLIHPNVVIGPHCKIGERCIVKSGSVIGQPGFGVFKDKRGRPQHFPHVGGVVIEHDVEIGALNTVCAGSIHPTVIGEFAKFDDHVHIAHNCIIGRRTQVTACAELSGSVVVGNDCWIGPNASVIDGITIGARSFIGIASNVTKPVPEGVVAVGNPARQIRPSGIPDPDRLEQDSEG